MCGVPFHSAETYINRLIEKGYKKAAVYNGGFHFETKSLFILNYMKDILNYRKGSGQILYCDYKSTLAFMEEIGQILDLFNMQYNRLVMHAGSLTLSRKN